MIGPVLLSILPKVILRVLAGLGIPKFQYELARAYYTAKFGEQDSSKAAMWCRRAAEQGWPPAESLLASFYVAAFGVPEDRDQVFYWNQRAAEHGDAGDKAPWRGAINKLLEHRRIRSWRLSGGWTPQNKGCRRLNTQWLNVYSKGCRIPVDIEMAEQWCRLALKNGAQSAAELLGRIETAAQAKPDCRA